MFVCAMRCRPLILRSAERAGTRFQLGEHRRGPPVSLIRKGVTMLASALSRYVVNSTVTERRTR